MSLCFERGHVFTSHGVRDLVWNNSDVNITYIVNVLHEILGLTAIEYG